MRLDIKHLFILQEIARIKDIVFHTFNDTLTGRLYRASMELFFLEIGINPTNLTINQYSIIEHLATPSLAKSAMIFLLQYKVILKHPIAFELQRVGDQMIMEALIAMDIPLDELMACNLCRLYMQVCYLSDIVTGEGSELLEEAWQGKPIPYLNRSSAWPTYHRPPMAYWNIWKRWITKAFLYRGRRLRFKLGRWYKWQDSWQWYTTTDGELFKYVGERWYTFLPVIRRQKLPMFEADPIPCADPISPLRATVYGTGSRLVCTGGYAIEPNIKLPRTSFADYLKLCII